MKERFLIVFLLCLIFLCSCAKKEYKIKVIDYSDSISEAKQKIEVKDFEVKQFVDKKESKHQIVKTNLGDIEADYSFSIKCKYQYFYVKEFKDMDKNIFRVDSNGKVTDYLWFNNKGEDDKKINNEEALVIANNFIEKSTNIDDYKISVKYDENNNMYAIEYEKYIGDVITADHAIIKIYDNGNLYSFSSSFLGMISIDSEISFDYERIHNDIVLRLDEIYKSAKKKYDKVEYEIQNYKIILLENGEFGLIYSVDIHCINQLDDALSSIISGKTTFFIRK